MTVNTTQTLTRPERPERPGRPATPAGTRPPRDSCAGDVVLAYLRIQAPALRTFGQVIPHTDSEQLAAELRWLGHRLGAARDDEVLSAHLASSLRPTPPELLIGPVQARIQGYYAPRRAAAHTALLEALDSPRYHRLLAELDRVAAGPPRGPLAGAPAREVLPAAVRHAFRQAKRRMQRARHTPAGQARDVALHRAPKS